jgi:hypothetical protein
LFIDLYKSKFHIAGIIGKFNPVNSSFVELQSRLL